jgi:hypothetical protein
MEVPMRVMSIPDPFYRMNLVSANVGIMHRGAIEVAGDVLCHPEVRVPGLIYTQGRSSCHSVLFGHIILFKMMPTLVGSMPNF